MAAGYADSELNIHKGDAGRSVACDSGETITFPVIAGKRRATLKEVRDCGSPLDLLGTVRLVAPRGVVASLVQASSTLAPMFLAYALGREAF
jgi:hypothetical protein